MKDNTILAKLKKFDCDIDNLTNYQNACGECRVCKYLEFLDYAGSVGMPGESTVEYNKEIDRYLEIREFYKSLLAKKMEEKEKEIADQLNEIDSVEYSFRNRKDDEYPSVRIHSGKYRHYFLSKSGLGDAVKEMFNWIKSNI